MSVPLFSDEVSFSPAEAAAVLRRLPAAAGVVALFGHSATDRPHLLEAADIRRRLARLLQPPEQHQRRLNLRDRIARIAWRTTASRLEASLLLYQAMNLALGEEETRRRMRLRAPFTIRYAVENRFPRIYVTDHLRRRSLHTTFGPFSSRLAAERYREAVEELFQIRRCFMELHPSPDDPGCIYGEIHKCLAPCQARVTDELYRAEAERVLSFLRTGGESLISQLAGERDRLSEEMDFEGAQAAHARMGKAREAAAQCEALVQQLDEFRAVVLIPSPEETGPVAQVFVFSRQRLHGPRTISLRGVRLAREQEKVGSSLFAQPMLLAAVPEHTTATENVRADASPAEAPGGTVHTANPEERLLATILELEDLGSKDGPGADSLEQFGAALTLLRRWFYRPEKQREGVLFFPEQGAWPARKMLRAAARLLMDRMTVEPAAPPASSPESDGAAIAAAATEADAPGHPAT